MTTNEFDYYLIYNTSEPNVPLLKNNDDADPEGTHFTYRAEYAIIEKPVSLALNSPVPSKPNFEVDYYQLPSPVFSQKIYEALFPLNIHGYQLAPAIIVDKKGKEHKDFWIENAYTRIECFDKEKSIYTYSSFTKTWTNIEKIVIDKEALAKIPLNERLVFRPKETRQFLFYHKTVVDAIMATNPVNIKFVSIEDWFEGVSFV